jgi:hypothetical protein
MDSLAPGGRAKTQGLSHGASIQNACQTVRLDYQPVAGNSARAPTISRPRRKRQWAAGHGPAVLVNGRAKGVSLGCPALENDPG